MREFLEEQGVGADEAGTGGTPCSFLRPTSWRQREGARGEPLVFLVISFVISLVRSTSSWVRPGRRAKGSLQRAATARTANRKTGQNVRRHDLYKSNTSMIKQKKKKKLAVS